MNTENQRSSMTLYSDPSCLLSHFTRFVMTEKNIEANIKDIVDGQWPEEVANINSYCSGPTLIDREIALFDAYIIATYFDERFVHPPLMPNDPVSRAKMRLMLHRINKDWYQLLEPHRHKSLPPKVRKVIQEDLTILAPLFESSPYFMGNDMSLLDCCLAPLLWRLPLFKIKLPAKAKAVEDYAQRIFSKDSFQASLSDIERAMR